MELLLAPPPPPDFTVRAQVQVDNLRLTEEVEVDVVKLVVGLHVVGMEDEEIVDCLRARCQEGHYRPHYSLLSFFSFLGKSRELKPNPTTHNPQPTTNNQQPIFNKQSTPRNSLL